MKKTGILFPISALPSVYGVGDFGQNAYQFIDKIAAAHLEIWQILPLNPLGYGHSPYQPLSSHAGDEIYLDIEAFIEAGLLYPDEVHIDNQQSLYVDYAKVRKQKQAYYRLAFSRFHGDQQYQEFVEKNKSWLYSYAIFRVFKSHHHERSWVEWPEEYKNYQHDQSFSLLPFTKDIDYQIFLQYFFFLQWQQLRDYAHQKNIEIIGDMPIYVGLDSADVWQNRECFLLEEDGTPSFVAGVPPDYFSKFGQRWGNPIYNWEYLKQHHYAFWVERMKASQQMYDRVRIDHFRGFDTYWKIPASEPTAVIGEWVEGPSYDLFDTLYSSIDHLSILAEDLGDLRDEVYQLRDHYHLKGMYVFQFHYAYDFDFSKVVVYSGTHDNDTLVGWLNTLDEDEYKKLEELLQDYSQQHMYQKILNYCLDLDAKEVIIPFWDLMGKDTSCRFNVPGKIGSPNWEYHLTDFQEFDVYLEQFFHMIKESKRGD